jgi:hypothetical protein
VNNRRGGVTPPRRCHTYNMSSAACERAKPGVRITTRRTPGSRDLVVSVPAFVAREELHGLPAATPVRS